MANATLNKTQVAAATKLLQGLGAKLPTTPSKQGYNAYVLAMAHAPGTQAQINVLAGLAPNNAHPNLHMGHAAVARYYKQVNVPQVAGVPFATLTPRCTAHGAKVSQCVATCTYGLYVVGQNKFAHVLLAKGGPGASQPTTPAPATTPTIVTSVAGVQAATGSNPANQLPN